MSASRDWSAIITAALKQEIAVMVAEETERAKSTIEKRINERTAEIVMAAMRSFDVARMEDRIIISVRDDRKSG